MHELAQCRAVAASHSAYKLAHKPGDATAYWHNIDTEPHAHPPTNQGPENQPINGHCVKRVH